MLGLAVFQALLNGIGWVLAWIYDIVGNYGLSIIVLTVVIKVILLPLGVKQIKSMQAMQAIQPKVKELQKKYKGNKQKQQEETMKLYREAGVNPLGGCLPLLLQFPILISMYAVIRAPIVAPVPAEGAPTAYAIENSHLPSDSTLFHNVVMHEDTNFVGMNLQCSAAQAGTSVELKDSEGNAIKPGLPLQEKGVDVPGVTSSSALNCGNNAVAKLPYFAILALMIGTTFYQQRQMTRASPAGAQSQQQQMVMKIMPALFGFLGYTFPAGLVVYWTTSNALQIGQQYALLRAGHIGPDALERRRQDMANKPAKKGGLFSGMMARAEEERKKRELPNGKQPNGKQRPASGGTPRRNPKSGAPKGGGTAKGGSPKGGTPRSGTPRSGTPKGGAPKGGNPRRKPGTAGRPPAKGTNPTPPPKEPGGSDDSGS
jgi:YidC/Oxa1 family membrane protein insertase